MKTSNNLFAIITAGGIGQRMNSQIPKQFIEINGKPILLITIEKFLSIDLPINIIITLPEKEIDFWDKLVNSNLDFEIYKKNIDRIKIVAGGVSRFQSVKNGLFSILQSEGIVAIHDGARPFVDSSIIFNSFQEAAKNQSAVCSVALTDSARIITETGNKIIDRSKIKLIQTPQTFNLFALKKAYNSEEKDYFTDDASVFEADGNSINLIEGSYRNIKITNPSDLELAKGLL